MNNILTALTIAMKAHGDRLDKSGHLEVLHPIRVMNLLPHDSDDSVKMAALFHDILEDTKWDEDRLHNEMILGGIDGGLAQATLRLVRLMTRVEDESYDAYMIRLCVSKRARIIKAADSTDNAQRDHSGIPDEDAIRMIMKCGNNLQTIAMSYMD